MVEATVHIPQTLHEAIKHFSDPDVAHNFAVTLRWPDGVTCPYCQSKRNSYISTRMVWACKDCKKRYSVKSGTIMEDSPLKLETWFAGMWLIANAKNGISSCEVSRALGVTQKTAWFLLHRVREVMRTGSFEKLAGTVQTDSTFIGGLEKNRHFKSRKNAGTGGAGKETVVGYYVDGQVRTEHVQATDPESTREHVRDNVEAGSTLHTDTAKVYYGLSEYTRLKVNHAVGQYAKDGVTTNHLEGYWSVLKRGLKGSYIHVDPRHLFRYLAEQEFRFNERDGKDGGRFAIVAASVTGKRLTYERLVTDGLQTLAP